MIFLFLVILITRPLSDLFAQSTEKDIRFYNLDKEYRRLKTIMIHPKSAAALELKLIVENMLSIYGQVYVNEKENALYITEVPEMLADIEKAVLSLDKKDISAGNNLISEVISLKHVLAAEIIDLVRHKLSKYGVVLNYEDQNAILITDIKSKIEELRSLIRLIDIPVEHIEIEVVIIEVNSEYYQSLGVNFFDWLSSSLITGQILRSKQGERVILDLNPVGFPSRAFDNSAEASIPSQNKTVLSATAQIKVSDIVRFIHEKNLGQVLATPKIICKNNFSASLFFGEKIPYPYEGTTFENTYPRYSPTFGADAGISLNVTPSIQKDDYINLVLNPSINNLAGWWPQGIPRIFHRRLNTEVNVKTGDTFVLGGMQKNEKVKIRRGIPVLKDIPILKYLFSVSSEIELVREIVMFIKPTVLERSTAGLKKEHLLLEKNIPTGKK